MDYRGKLAFWTKGTNHQLQQYSALQSN